MRPQWTVPGVPPARHDQPSRSTNAAEPPRANPTAQPAQTQITKGAYTRPMSNLIAKIRHWLHLEKKPKT